MNSLNTFFKSLAHEILTVSLSLFKIMIPVMIIIKIAQELGAIELLSWALAPLMHSVGLPEEMGLVWATTIFSNIYAGIVVYSNLDLATPLSIAQVSVLGSMMLLAHSLPIEAAIAKKAGVSLSLTLLIRIGGGLLLGFLLHLSYEHFQLLQQPAQSLWQQSSSTDPSLLGWATSQLKSLAIVFIAISVLLFCLRILRLLGIERLMAWMLHPFLKLLGISRQATSLTITGITLGLSFGGGLLLNEARQGHIPPKDIFAAIMLLNLAHSLIEDTLIILLLGADFYSIFWGRLVFSVIVIALLMRLVNFLGDPRCDGLIYRSVAVAPDK